MKYCFFLLFLFSCNKVEKQYLKVGNKVVTRFDFVEKGNVTLLELDSIEKIEDTSNYIFCKHYPLRDGFEILIIKDKFGFLGLQPQQFFEASSKANIRLEGFSSSEESKEFYKRVYSNQQFGFDSLLLTPN